MDDDIKDIIQPIIDELSSFIEKDTFTTEYPSANIYPPDKIYSLIRKLHDLTESERIKVRIEEGWRDNYRCHVNGHYNYRGENKRYRIYTDWNLIWIDFKELDYPKKWRSCNYGYHKENQTWEPTEYKLSDIHDEEMGVLGVSYDFSAHEPDLHVNFMTSGFSYTPTPI